MGTRSRKTLKVYFKLKKCSGKPFIVRNNNLYKTLDESSLINETEIEQTSPASNYGPEKIRMGCVREPDEVYLRLSTWSFNKVTERTLLSAWRGARERMLFKTLFLLLLFSSSSYLRFLMLFFTLLFIKFCFDVCFV